MVHEPFSGPYERREVSTRVNNVRLAFLIFARFLSAKCRSLCFECSWKYAGQPVRHLGLGQPEKFRRRGFSDSLASRFGTYTMLRR